MPCLQNFLSDIEQLFSGYIVGPITFHPPLIQIHSEYPLINDLIAKTFHNLIGPHSTIDDPLIITSTAQLRQLSIMVPVSIHNFPTSHTFQIKFQRLLRNKVLALINTLAITESLKDHIFSRVNLDRANINDKIKECFHSRFYAHILSETQFETLLHWAHNMLHELNILTHATSLSGHITQYIEPLIQELQNQLQDSHQHSRSVNVLSSLFFSPRLVAQNDETIDSYQHQSANSRRSQLS